MKISKWKERISQAHSKKRKYFLPHIIKLTLRKISKMITEAFRGTFLIPIWKVQSHNMTFIVRKGGNRSKLYEIDVDSDLFLRFYRLHEIDLIPEVLGVNGNFIHVEWVKGRPLSEMPLPHQAKTLGELLARIHTKQEESGEWGFRHLERLKTRFVTHLSILAPDDRKSALDIIDTIDRDYGSIEKTLESSCVHPDMISDNVIIQDDGIQIVDNEFYFYGKGKEFDIINTLNSLPKQYHEDFLSEYGLRNTLSDFENYSLFWEKVYLLKMTSKFMRLGNHRKLSKYFDKLRRL